MSYEPIVMPNEGHERTEYGVRWTWKNDSVSYGAAYTSRPQAEARIERMPGLAVSAELMQRTITITQWEPVLPPGVLRLHEIAAEEYGGIRVAELGDGVVEGYNVVAFTDDPEKAIRAVRAHFVMAHNDTPDLALCRQNEPVRWWQVYDNCGCGNVCRHIDGEDHGCKRWGLPPCRKEDEDGAAWVSELCEKDTPGAVPFVEIEVGPDLTRDEQMVVLRDMLGEAEKRLRDLSKTCLAVKPTLDKPYSDAPGTTPWKRHVELYTRLAYDYAVEIRRHLNSTGTAS